MFSKQVRRQQQVVDVIGGAGSRAIAE